MKIEIWMIGKAKTASYADQIDSYFKRLRSYMEVSYQYLDLKEKEIESQQYSKVIGKLKANDQLIILDEKGKQMTSAEFASFIEGNVLTHPGKSIFLIGGAYGFSQEIYDRSQKSMALSKMTFPHQMARLIFSEQLYRAFSIINNSPYHHT